MSNSDQESGPSTAGSIARLSLLLFLVALLVSRVALIAHEFAGHAAPAVILGGTLEGHRLYLFAGGFVSFTRSEAFTLAERLLISLGGIGVEITLGGIALWGARHWPTTGLRRFVALSFATIVLVHAGYYLASSSFHGYGDGRLLHLQLGASRLWFALAVATATLVGCYFLVIRLLDELPAYIPGHARRLRLASLSAAVVAAASLHGALAFGELRIAGSARYGVVMQRQSDRDSARELARLRAAARARGTPMSPGQIAETRRSVARRHRQFPFGIALAIALVAAAFAAAWRAESDSEKHDTNIGITPAAAWKRIRRVGLLCGLALLVVLLLRGG